MGLPWRRREFRSSPGVRPVCWGTLAFGGNDYEDVLQHITDEIEDLYNGFEEVPNESIEKKAQRYMTEAIQRTGKPMLIVIDGINQIANRNQAKLLNWLPQSTHRVKYLFSTLEDDETMCSSLI